MIRAFPSFALIGRTGAAWLSAGCLPLVLIAIGGITQSTGALAAVPSATDPIVRARTAFTHRDRATLVRLRDTTLASAHPLAMWVDYWELNLRLPGAKQADVEAFYARWPGTAVEERLRKDWITERGKHGDVDVLNTELPRVRINADRDRDREIECYALSQRHDAGENVVQRARALWFAQREADHGCALLAANLYRAGQLTNDDVWARAHLAAEQGRRFVAQQAIGLLGTVKIDMVQQAFLQPTQFLARRSAKPTVEERELAAFAIIRLATRNASAAATALDDARWATLPPHAAGAAWSVIAKEAAIGARPQAYEWYQRATMVAAGERFASTPDTLAWKVRAALRAEDSTHRWRVVLEAIDAMSDAQLTDPTWVYWKARALQAEAAAGPDGQPQRNAARRLLEDIRTRLYYYGWLAAAELGQDLYMPARPPALTDAERMEAKHHAGLMRGLDLLGLRLRDEGLVEWRHALHGMNDRSLRAAAQLACDAQMWSLCISTSERTQVEIDMAQRFPTPYRDQVDSAARETNVEPAHLYAVIRQESHFSASARSVAGAAGLMQLMPQTARWVATRYRIPYQRDRIHDPATNVRIGAHYLRLVMNDFGGSHARAAAAYNAGPSRPRLWSKVAANDAAVWTEIIPINETRDYVKNVLANVAYYQAVMNSGAPTQTRPFESPPSADEETTVAQIRDNIEWLAPPP